MEYDTPSSLQIIVERKTFTHLQELAGTIKKTSKISVLNIKRNPYALLNEHMCRLVGKPTMWFPNRSDTNRPEQSQKRSRSLKFWS